MPGPTSQSFAEHHQVHSLLTADLEKGELVAVVLVGRQQLLLARRHGHDACLDALRRLDIQQVHGRRVLEQLCIQPRRPISLADLQVWSQC